MMAAAYLDHLVRNHAFIDGNQRIGANAAITFLYLSDWELHAFEEDFAELALGVAQGRIQKEEIAAFLEGNSAPVPK